MKFMVGYQLMADSSLLDALLRCHEDIYEVYFAWGDIPNGRGLSTESLRLSPFEAQSRQFSELENLSKKGIKLNLLLNGNCYGGQSLSRNFFNKIGNVIEGLSERINLQSVTTTSPVIARFIKNNFPALQARASVNMEIGSTQGMDYVAEYFDGYYMQRELNRDLSAIKHLKNWCDTNGKELYMLANSGCLNHCSVHNFHDNLVAHEHEIMSMDNAFDFRGICHDYLAKKEKQISIIRDTNFVRPEDIHLYEPYFSAIKLATRTSRNPAAVLEAYVGRKYIGNVTELMEPNHAESLYPDILENSKFPPEFGERLLSCDKNCSQCDFCCNVFNKVKINLDKIGGSVCVNQ
ncbi:MAG: hypothetical protein A2020_12010 [Lentisphaerae bacterium GWF2_45_14]|nr:MAG: hypothetical protein A2020_12010 [Lentisphaerae bacterium GWF2_45_14]